MNTDTHGERVKASILAAGVALLRECPAAGITSGAIGRSIGMTRQAVLYHFGSAALLRDAVAREAIRSNDADAIRYLIVTKNPAIDEMAGSERDRYMSA